MTVSQLQRVGFQGLISALAAQALLTEPHRKLESTVGEKHNRPDEGRRSLPACMRVYMAEDSFMGSPLAGGQPAKTTITTNNTLFRSNILFPTGTIDYYRFHYR